MAAGLLVAAAGLVLLALAGADSPYLALLPGFLLWGCGLGLLTLGGGLPARRRDALDT
jgi:hypothetical protein